MRKSSEAIKNSKAKIAMGHFEINGFKATRGHMMEDGMDKEVFDKFDNVFSGHFILVQMMERFIILVIHMRCFGMM